jgi:tetratricopeptide (TPR) repeat protein
MRNEENTVVADVERLVQAGDYAGATSAMESWLATQEQRFGGAHPELLETLGALSTFYLAQGESAKAERALVRALEIIEASMGAGDPALAGVLLVLARIRAARGEYAEVEALLQRGLTIVQNSFGEQHPSLVQFLVNLADLFRARGAHPRAEPLYRRALEIAETADADDTALATILDGLGAACMMQAKYAEAETALGRALTLKYTGCDAPSASPARSPRSSACGASRTTSRPC